MPSQPSDKFKSTSELQHTKAERKRYNKPVGNINGVLNTRKTTSSIKSEIRIRQSQGKPTRQLRTELSRR